MPIPDSVGFQGFSRARLWCGILYRVRDPGASRRRVAQQDQVAVRQPRVTISRGVALHPFLLFPILSREPCPPVPGTVARIRTRRFVRVWERELPKVLDESACTLSFLWR